MFRLEISACLWAHCWLPFSFPFFFFNTFWPFAAVLEMLLASSVLYQYGAEGLIRKQKESLYVFMHASLTPPLVWCPCCGSTRALANTHSGPEAAGGRCLRRLLLPPDGLHHGATGLFLPCFLCPPPPTPPPQSWTSLWSYTPTATGSHSHTPGHQDTMRKFQQHLLILEEDVYVCFRQVVVWKRSVVNHHINMLKLIHIIRTVSIYFNWKSQMNFGSVHFINVERKNKKQRNEFCWFVVERCIAV